MDFTELTEIAHTKRGIPHENTRARILSFDPGHTTGWAAFEEGVLVDAGQIDTKSLLLCLTNASPLLARFTPRVVVMEDYRVYKWRQKQHVGSELLTAQVIGSLETLALQHSVNHIVKQPASVAKNFCTDAKLREWGYYDGVKGLRHARDAIRHGCYFILFGAIRKADKSGEVVVG